MHIVLKLILAAIFIAIAVVIYSAVAWANRIWPYAVKPPTICGSYNTLLDIPQIPPHSRNGGGLPTITGWDQRRITICPNNKSIVTMPYPSGAISYKNEGPFTHTVE
jgi:hypothetical protein